MAQSLNKIILIGRVGKDPEFKTFDWGQVTSFSLATSSTTGKGDTKKEVTEWHNVSVFGKGAEMVRDYVKKGSLLCIEGRIKYREYENKDGVKMRATDIVSENVTFLDSKGSTQGGQPASQTNEATREGLASVPDDDLPF